MFTFIHSAFVTDDVLVRVVCSFVCFFQGGRRDFSRREITALVGSPGNMAVYRHLLVIPPTAKVLTPKNEKPPTAKTLPLYSITAEKIPPYFGFTASAKKVPPTLDTAKKNRQKSTDNSRYRSKGTANTGCRPKGTTDTGYRPKGTADTGYRPKGKAYTPKRYRAHWIPPKN